MPDLNTFYGPNMVRLIETAVHRQWVDHRCSIEAFWRRIEIETQTLYGRDVDSDANAAEALRIIHAIDLMMLGL